MPQDLSSAASPMNLFGAVEQVGKLVGLTAATLLVLSTAYDFSFLYALGLSFEDVPSTLADHARSAIVWAPRAAIYVLAFTMYEMFMRRTENGLSEEELIHSSPNPKFTRAFRRGPSILFGITVVLLVVGDVLFTASSHGLFVAGIGTWGMLSLAIVRHPRMGAQFSTTGGRLFVIVPIVVMWVGLLGYGRAASMLSSTSVQWTVELKAAQGTVKRQLLGLRRFSSSAILVAADRTVSVLPSESIIAAELIRTSDADAPRVCRWFGISCAPTKP